MHIKSLNFMDPIGQVLPAVGSANGAKPAVVVLAFAREFLSKSGLFNMVTR